MFLRISDFAFALQVSCRVMRADNNNNYCSSGRLRAQTSWLLSPTPTQSQIWPSDAFCRHYHKRFIRSIRAFMYAFRWKAFALICLHTRIMPPVDEHVVMDTNSHQRENNGDRFKTVRFLFFFRVFGTSFI